MNNFLIYVIQRFLSPPEPIIDINHDDIANIDSLEYTNICDMWLQADDPEMPNIMESFDANGSPKPLNKLLNI
jgi:hypothetical protein